MSSIEKQFSYGITCMRMCSVQEPIRSGAITSSWHGCALSRLLDLNPTCYRGIASPLPACRWNALGQLLKESATMKSHSRNNRGIGLHTKYWHVECQERVKDESVLNKGGRNFPCHMRNWIFIGCHIGNFTY